MSENKNNYCLILAGGKGKRLWPCSREDCPKQFMDFFSTGKTLIQDTYERMRKFIPAENVYVSTNKDYAHLVEEQLPEIPKEHILSEPIFRNTAPSVAWAAYRIAHVAPESKARLVVVPSDQAVFNEDAFKDNVLEGLDFVGNNDSFLTMGVKPTRPEPGYGYIQKGEATSEGNVFKVKSFTEKPDREFAKVFMNSGEFYWNTGLFLSNVNYLGECLRDIFPIGAGMLNESVGKEYSIEKELEMVEKMFPACPNLSIDYGILDKNDRVCVMRCDFGWADLGMWHSIYESMSKVEGDNVVISSRVIMDNSKGNIVKLPDDHMGIINGLDGYIVAEKGNVLLICKKEDSSALIRKYINEVQVKYGEEFI
ncbi:MAG: mannose-1-phosphate guanylyltransferase [Prevotellaceae bacterium]|nr:mannose-1-phosphate guanylyltransferase [Prevotellaceae bacterium]